MEISSETSIGFIATELEEAIPYFEKWKMDYTGNGSLTLKEACDRTGASVEEAMATLQALEKASPFPLDRKSVV